MDKHCALLAIVREGPDEAAAAAVAAFAGDINAFDINTFVPGEETVLHAAVERLRPLTVAALAARGDCNPNVVTRTGTPVLCRVAGPYRRTDMAAFLTQFPTLDVDACDSMGCTPLHYAGHWDRSPNAQLLLDAGADPTRRTQRGHTPTELALRTNGRTDCTKLLEAAATWHAGLRRGWLCAVVCLSKI